MKSNSNAFSRWLMVSMATAIMALLSVGAWFYHDQEQNIRKKIEEDLSAVARLKADQIAAWRKDQLAKAAFLQLHPFLSESIARFIKEPLEKNERELRVRFRSLADQHGYADMLLVAPDGKPLFSLVESVDSHHGYLPALAEALRDRKPVFTNLNIEGPGNSPHISVVAPIYKETVPGAEPLAALVLINDASQFLYPLIQFWPTPSETAETFLVRREGDEVLFLNDLRHRPDTALKLRIPLSQTDVPAVMAVQGKEGVFQGKDYRGVEVVSVILPVPDSPWFMIAKIDAAEAFAEWHFRSILMLVLLFGLTAFIGTAGLVLWQRDKKAQYRALYLSEAALRANAERHRITLRAVGDAVISTDAQGMVELLNPPAEVLTGWKQDEARGRPLREVFRIISEETREPSEDPVAKVLREGLVVGLANHTILVARDGTERPIADSGAPIRYETGEITGVVLVFRDQSAERAANQQLDASNQQLRATERQLRQGVELLDATGRMARVGGWEVDAKTLEVKWTEQTYRLHEVPIDHMPPLEEAINFFHPEEQPRLKDAIQRALEHGEPYDMELRFITAKGNHLWTRTYCEPEIVDGKTVRLKGVFQDITDRKRAEEELRKHRDHLEELVEERTREMRLLTKEQQVILDTASAMIWFKDTRNNVIRVNKAAAAVFGSTPEALARKSMTELFGGDSDRYYQDDLEVIRTGKPKLGIVEPQMLAGGEKGWVRTDKVPYLDDNGDVAGLIVFSVDITDRIQAEEAIKRYSKQLEAANKELEAFAYSVSHDLRAPLRSIDGFSEALIEDCADKLDEQGKDYLRRVRAGAQRMANLIDDLLKLSRITRWEMENRKFDISALARKTVESLRQSQPERDVDVVIADGLEADGDIRLLRVVMENLLGNAWKFSGRTANALIEVGRARNSELGTRNAELADDAVAYFVRDNGAGFDMDYADKLFGAFQRLHSTAEFEGTGIGLATVQRAVLRHGGRVWAEGEVGKGATFYFTLGA